MELGNRCRNRDKRGNMSLKHLNEEQGEQWDIVCTGKSCINWDTSFQGECSEKQGLGI